jgi:hypothetical protein
MVDWSARHSVRLHPSNAHSMRNWQADGLTLMCSAPRYPQPPACAQLLFGAVCSNAIVWEEARSAVLPRGSTMHTVRIDSTTWNVSPVLGAAALMQGLRDGAVFVHQTHLPRGHFVAGRASTCKALASL